MVPGSAVAAQRPSHRGGDCRREEFVADKNLPKVSEAAKLFAALLSPRVPDNFENQPGVDLFISSSSLMQRQNNRLCSRQVFFSRQSDIFEEDLGPLPGLARNSCEHLPKGKTRYS